MLIFAFLPAVLVFVIPTLLTYFLVRRNKVEYLSLPEGKRYAGFWERFIAGIIDNVILYIIGFVIGFVLVIFFSYQIPQESIRGITGLLTWFYYVLQQTSKDQATLGMKVMKIKIYNENYERVGFWRLTGRYFCTLLSLLLLGLGFFMIGWTKRKQGLHDIIARTIHLKE